MFSNENIELSTKAKARLNLSKQIEMSLKLTMKRQMLKRRENPGGAK